jgi:hypothetical protein
MCVCSEEETENFTAEMFSPCFLVVHNAARRRKDQESELTGRQKVAGVLLEVFHLNVEPGADHTALVDAARKVDNHFAGTMIVDDFEFANVSVLHHNCQEANDNFRAWANDHLAFATLFRIVYALEGIRQNAHTNHC